MIKQFIKILTNARDYFHHCEISSNNFAYEKIFAAIKYNKEAKLSLG